MKVEPVIWGREEKVEPGIYTSMSRAEYDSIKAVNQSTLKKWVKLGLNRCPAYFFENQYEFSDSSNMRLGRVVDNLLLSGIIPAIYPGKTRSGKAWEEFEAQHSGGEIVLESDWRAAQGMVASLRKDDTEGMFGDTVCKAVLVGELCGVLCKAELDRFSHVHYQTIADIKTTDDASPKVMGKLAADLGYHFQAAFYLDLCNVLGHMAERFEWRVVERDVPHCVARYYLDINDSEIEAGRSQYRTALLSYSDALANNQWPSYGEIKKLTMPDWALKL
jgi:hypothetical protein